MQMTTLQRRVVDGVVDLRRLQRRRPSEVKKLMFLLSTFGGKKSEQRR
jgi:hypothetical protein